MLNPIRVMLIKAHIKELHSPVKEPRSRIVCPETDGNVVYGCAGAHSVTADRVDIIVLRHTRASDDVKMVL